MPKQSGRGSPKKRRKGSRASHADAKGGSIATTRGKAAKAIGVHVSTLDDWLADGAPGKPGRYDVAAIQRWHDENRRSTIDANGSGHSTTYSEARARRELAMAKLAELELAQRQGELVEIGIPRNIMCRTIATAKALYEGTTEQVLAVLPTTLGADDQARIKTEIERIVYSIQSALSEGLKELAKKDEGANDDGESSRTTDAPR